MTSTCCYDIAVRIAVVAWFCVWVVRVKRDLERVHGAVAVGVRFERGLYHTVYRLLSGLFRLAWYRLFRLILPTGVYRYRCFSIGFAVRFAVNVFLLPLLEFFLLPHYKGMSDRSTSIIKSRKPGTGAFGTISVKPRCLINFTPSGVLL